MGWMNADWIGKPDNSLMACKSLGRRVLAVPLNCALTYQENVLIDCVLIHSLLLCLLRFF